MQRLIAKQKAQMGPSLILIHSPFLGPATWRSTARALQANEWRVHVPNLLAVAQSARVPYWPQGSIPSSARPRMTSAAVDVTAMPGCTSQLITPSRAGSCVFVDAAAGAGHPRLSARARDCRCDVPPWTSWSAGTLMHYPRCARTRRGGSRATANAVPTTTRHPRRTNGQPMLSDPNAVAAAEWISMALTAAPAPLVTAGQLEPWLIQIAACAAAARRSRQVDSHRIKRGLLAGA